MNTKRRATALALAAFVGALASVGCTSAAGSPSTAATAATAVAPASSSPSSSVSRTAHIMAYSINSDGPAFEVILTGAIGDWGQAVSVYPNGAVDPDHTSQLSLKLTRGSFRLSISRLDAGIVSAYHHWPSNPGTCSGSIAVTAATPIVAGSGTGSYRGISGTFTVTATIDEIDVKPVCDGTSPFREQVIFIAGSGPVSG
jgi:hypothetical protein